MTYLHRLAMRIAGLRRAVVVVCLSGLACTKGEKTEFLDPNPNPATPVASSLRVEPLIAAVQSGAQIQFTAIASTVTGTTVPVTVDWTASGANIAPDGRFTGELAGLYWVVARIRNGSIADSARVSVYQNENQLVELIVFPDSAYVETDDSIQAYAAYRLSNGDITQQAMVTWAADGGRIDEAGIFTASDSGFYTLSAASPTGLRANARVLVRRRTRHVVQFSINPPVATLNRGESASFEASALMSDGNLQIDEGVWSATGGSITSRGLYTAGGTPGTYQVIVRDRNGTVADTAQVAVRSPVVADLALSPKTLTIEPGATKQFSALARMDDNTWQAVPLAWSATAGAITSSGLYTAPAAAGSYSVVVTSPGIPVADTAYVIVNQPAATMTALQINPSSVSLGGGEFRQFAAVADWSDGSVTTPLVTWTATGGQISMGGRYDAGAVPGNYRVIATAASGLADTAAAIVIPANLTGLTLTPGSASVLVGASVQLTVSGSWSDGGSASPPVVWNAAGGAVDGNQVFTAGAVNGTFPVIATAQGGSLADTSFITISTPAAGLNSLLLSPASVVLAPGAGIDFTVTGNWSDGSTTPPPAIYTATGGAMSGKRYTAGTTAGTYRVIARHATGSKADTSSVVVTTLVTLSTLTTAPQTASVAPGASQQFTAAATWSNGSTAVPLVNWTATGGTITSTGRYSAGTIPGSFRVIAAHQGGPRRDTADVTVLGTPPPPPAVTLTTLSISPKPVSVALLATRQFTLSALWSDGSTAVPAVTWSATGGTVSPTGLYTAGSVAGTYLVTATHQGGTRADTATVTLTGAPVPVVTSITLTPASANVLVGTSRSFSALGRYNDGSTGVVPVTWSATGGTVTSGGVYTAGASTGNHQLTATMVGGLVSANAAISVTVAGPTSCVGGANQPAGYYPIAGRHFNSLGTTNPATGYGNGRGTGSLPCMTGQSEGWDDIERKYGNITLTQDATSPLSPGGILRQLYPPHTVAPNTTYSPGVAQMTTMAPGTRKLYFRTAFRVSANWQGHPTLTNKMFFVRSQNGAEPIIRLRGAGGGPLQLNVDLQGSLRDKRNLGNQSSLIPNKGVAAAGDVPRGQWHVLEGVLEMGTNGQANGRLRLWLNGVLTHDYTDIEYEATTTRSDWGYIHIASTWGGGQGTINQLMWMDFDDFFVSGAP